MCGLVGMAGSISAKEEKMFRDMLICNAIRGLDSAGVAFVGVQPSATAVTEKVTGSSQNLWEWGMSDLMTQRGIAKQRQKVMIGHNRAATYGLVNDENAHPFNFDHITGVHNGSLTHWTDLEGYADFDVDSMAIFKTIADKGIDHCWKNFYGAAALVWWDESDDSLNLIHNSQRPLFVAWSEDEKTIFWSSEDWIIDGLADKHGVKLREDTEDNPNLFELKDDVLHKFKPTPTACPLVEVRELEKKAAPTYGKGGNTAMGGQPYRPANRVWKSPSYKKSKVSPIINAWWAQDLLKADKSVRGKSFRVITGVDSIENERSFKYLLCETEDGERLEIYPDRLEEFEQYVHALTLGEVTGEITERPRVKTVVSKNKTTKFYRVSARGVRRKFSVKRSEQLLYKTFRGALVTKEEWHIAVNMSNKGDCAFCGNPLDIVDHAAHEWLDTGDILCEYCKDDDELKQVLIGRRT